ncbi:DUF933 domain-containing protein [Chloroflexota bacterium]
MSVDIGIIGLPQSGRTTIFNALTRGLADTGSGVSHIGMARVPEPRLEVLDSTLHPKRVVPAEVRYIDIGASIKSLAEEKGSRDQLLSQIGNVDALINVARVFADDTVPHPDGSLDVDRDITNMNLELTFYDLALLEKRLQRIGDSLKGAKPAEKPPLLREQELLIRIKGELEKDVPIRELNLTKDEVKAISGYQFLTAKPLLILVNIGEEQQAEAASLEAELNAKYARPDCRVIALCGKLEMELGQLDDAAAAEELRAEYGIEESALDRAIKVSYELLGLVSFFTIASGEVRAWSVKRNTEAAKAAGKIHTDMERGFIRAEAIGFNDLVKCGGIAEARKRGLLRLEGKNYIVQDGDVITFLFNV